MELGALDAAERESYLTALGSTHRISLDVNVYDGDEVFVGQLDGNVITGQVDADSTADITRTLALEIEDPELKFAFDLLGPISAERFIGVHYLVWVDDLSDWVRVPVFYGPVSHFERNAHSVTLEAVGKEALLLPPVPPNAPNNPGDDRLVGFIKAAAQAHGETKFRLGDGNGTRLPKNYKVVGTNETGIWPIIRRVASDHNRQLYYDTEGYLRLRRWPTNSSEYTFTDLLSEPAVSYDLAEIRNVVKVYGADTKGHAVLKADVELPATHPFSAQSLERNGVNRKLLETVETNNEKLTAAEAHDMARRILARKSQGILSVEFDALPVPHLELGDVIRVDTETINTAFALTQYSLPLSADGPMSVGRTKAVAWKKLRQAIG